MKYPRRAAFLLAAVGAVPLAAAEKAPAAPPPPEVGFVEIAPRTITLLSELNGRVTPYLVAEVRPQVNGIVLERRFREGSDVKADEPLYQIDPALYQAQLENAQAVHTRAVASAELAKAEEKRYLDLLSRDAATQEQVDEKVAARKQAEAEVKVAQAQVDTALINVKYTRVLAPIAGRIGKSSVTQGALVTAAQPSALATIQQLDPIYVDIPQPSRDFLRLKRRIAPHGGVVNTGENYARVRLRLEDKTRYPHAGEIRFADVTIDQTTSSILLRAQFPNPDFDLLPGMFVRVTLESETIENALLVPQRGVARVAGGVATVLVVGADNTVERRPVKADRVFEDNWIVDGGLKAGEKVIVEGTQRVSIRPGQPAPKVTPVPFVPPAARSDAKPGVQSAPSPAPHPGGAATPSAASPAPVSAVSAPSSAPAAPASAKDAAPAVVAPAAAPSSAAPAPGPAASSAAEDTAAAQ